MSEEFWVWWDFGVIVASLALLVVAKIKKVRL